MLAEIRTDDNNPYLPPFAEVAISKLWLVTIHKKLKILRCHICTVCIAAICRPTFQTKRAENTANGKHHSIESWRKFSRFRRNTMISHPSLSAQSTQNCTTLN